MLIYPNQHELDLSDNRAAMGLARRSSPNVILEGSSCACHEITTGRVEEMLKEEGSDIADAVSGLPGTLRLWNYDDFNLTQIGEGFFGNVYKVCQPWMQFFLSYQHYVIQLRDEISL